MIGTIHGPGTPGGSVEPVVSASTSCEEESNVFMVVEDDDDDEVVEVGTTQGFTKIVELKREKVDPPHASRGRGVGDGVSRGGPPRGDGRGSVVIPPIPVDDPGANDDDDDLPKDLLEEGGEELVFDDPDEGEGEDDEDNEEEEDKDEAQASAQFSKPASEGQVPFNPEIHDITGYEKADII